MAPVVDTERVRVPPVELAVARRLIALAEEGEKIARDEGKPIVARQMRALWQGLKVDADRLETLRKDATVHRATKKTRSQRGSFTA